MSRQHHFRIEDWRPIFCNIKEIREDLSGSEIIIDRFMYQYLPAALAAKNQESYDRAWRAFWHYLTMPTTTKKPISLTYSSADCLISMIQELMNDSLKSEQQ